jgi:hypothetical protein
MQKIGAFAQLTVGSRLLEVLSRARGALQLASSLVSHSLLSTPHGLLLLRLTPSPVSRQSDLETCHSLLKLGGWLARWQPGQLFRTRSYCGHPTPNPVSCMDVTVGVEVLTPMLDSRVTRCTSTLRSIEYLRGVNRDTRPSVAVPFILSSRLFSQH